ITKKTPACFEPVLDYTVVKIPRWNFEKFPQTSPELGTQMKAIGETMAIGRTFKEALQKAIRSLESDCYGFGSEENLSLEYYQNKLKKPTPERLFYVGELLRQKVEIEELYSLTGIDKWFLYQINEIIQEEKNITKSSLNDRDMLLSLKKAGFSDKRIAQLSDETEEKVRNSRKNKSLKPVFKVVDTCAAEFESTTTYLYSTYEEENEARRSNKPKVIILGSGPNRIGQGIEFDYCCVHAVMALQEAGYETIMINNNPETVSTDYDTANKLYFEPLTIEDVLHVIELEKPEGIIVQFGGQTPLKLAYELDKNGVHIFGTSPKSIDLAEDRSKFGKLIKNTNIKQPEWGTAFTLKEAKNVSQKIGFPVLLRPSYVLGGRGMEIVYDNDSLEKYIIEAASISTEYPVFIDKFLEDAFEFDIDAIRDGNKTIICGFMQHIEEAGIHSGDSSCVLPPYMIGEEDYQLIVEQTKYISDILDVKGLINIQFALRDGEIYVLEVNPRASRTIPFVSKAVGSPWAKIAAKIMVGHSLDEFKIDYKRDTGMIAVKTPVFPFMSLAAILAQGIPTAL
ncbi:MAG: carbamoyl-phosphate synthase large subunit, partial [bacterium]